MKNVSEAVKKLDSKRMGFFNDRFTKYIVDYTVKDDHIFVYSNIGKKRKLKNTESNIKTLDKIIVRNKILISRQIDEYEHTEKERFIVLLINIILLFLSGMIIPFAFFTGSYKFFLSSIVLFSVLVISSTIIGTDYYILLKEIKNLKRITGYKKENEFNYKRLDVKTLESR